MNANTEPEPSEIYKVTGVTPSLLLIEIVDVAKYHAQAPDKKLSIGSYLKVSDEKGLTIIAIVQGFRIKDAIHATSDTASNQPVFVVEAQQVGCFEDGRFRRGGQQIAIPPTMVEVASDGDLDKIYEGVPDKKQFAFGTLSQNGTTRVILDGDRFFGKHVGVVGSTGSGKSCTVAKILQEGKRRQDGQAGMLSNAHIIIFDLHGEYGPAFPDANVVSVDNLALPYWLMSSEELEEMFIESQEQNSHNQVSQFRLAVTENKKRYNVRLEKVTYDTPVYFSLNEVYRYIYNLNCATKDAKTGRIAIKVRAEEIEERYQFFEEIEFEERKPQSFSGGPYAGEFDRFVSRLNARINDERLDFVLCPSKPDGQPYRTEDFPALLRQFTGYLSERKANVTIVDLSGVPFEILSVVVSLITRLVFDFCFHYKRLKALGEEAPFLLVYEEAHNYVPQGQVARYGAVKKSIERIAKEGRKYGVSLMIVSQRPSEVSETIFSQCNNFVAMRLTNPADQQYIRRLLPDSVSAVTDALPMLEKQEAIIIGDAIPVPSLVRVDEISNRPDSCDIDFHTEWKKDWLDLKFDDVISRMKKEKAADCLQPPDATG